MRSLLTFILFAVTVRAQLDTFDYCIRMTPSPGILQCAGQQALSSLQFLEEASNFTLASGVLMIKDESLVPSSRIIPNIVDHDPLDFRGILENAGAVMAQRQLLWDMGIIYPGLKLRLGPTIGAAGLLEFVLDPSVQNDERSLFEEKSTARILTKSFVVPFLLGLKFNLATLLPLVFGGLILLSKKALILGKIALFLSGLFGYGSFLTPSLYGGGFGGYGGGGFSGHGSVGGFGFGSKPFRYNNPFADSPDFDSHHQHHHHVHQDDYHGAGVSHDTSSSYYKKKDKFLNLDERVEPQTASSLVDKFYEYENDRMPSSRIIRWRGASRHLLNRARSCFDSGQLVECFRGEVFRALDRAIDSNVTFRVTPFVTVRRNPDYPSGAHRSSDIARLSGWSGLFRKLHELVLSRLFQLSLVDVDGRALLDSTEEGRGKKHKHKQGGMFSMALMALMAMIAQVILGKVAVLAAVALIMAKIALVFSTLNGLKKANGAGGGHAAEHVVYEHSSHGGGGGGGGGWQRSIEPRKPYPRYQYYEEDDLPYWKRRPEHDYQDAYEGA
ncbi:uncharacterized protein LOC118502423 [Anopheles stephensi]|uniref:uncharacterized protein LOC118502423 n=1 Tax=Anopheles stephensi TaxID=30069 RepID=UPI001658B357|nr:uncharacterized protein LOC118502423 [Anopheles stephensi]